MDGPDISPLLARIGGQAFRSEIRDRLEQLAKETDDAAYASRLRLVARGQRPLRTLLHDPQWTRQFESTSDSELSTERMSDDNRSALDEWIANSRSHSPDVFLTSEQAKADAQEIAHMAERTSEIARQEALSGWSYNHGADSDPDGTESSERGS